MFKVSCRIPVLRPCPVPVKISASAQISPPLRNIVHVHVRKRLKLSISWSWSLHFIALHSRSDNTWWRSWVIRSYLFCLALLPYLVGDFLPCNGSHNPCSIFGMETLPKTAFFFPQCRILGKSFKRHVCGLRNKCQTDNGLHCQWFTGMERFPEGPQGPSPCPGSCICSPNEGKTRSYGLYWFVDSE